jgi:hypothetical protein
MREGSHKRADHIYVTLHGLHDLKEIPRETQNSLPATRAQNQNAAPAINPKLCVLCVLLRLNCFPADLRCGHQSILVQAQRAVIPQPTRTAWVRA